MKTLRLLSAILLMGGIAFAQTTKSNASFDLTIVAAPIPATVTATPSATTVTAGQPVTVNIAVSGPTGDPVPTGNVNLIVDSVVLQTYPLTNGAVACTYTAPTVASALGVHHVVAEYEGDPKLTAQLYY